MLNFNSHLNVPSPSFQPNELNERLVGIPALNPFFRSVSGPRAAMFNKHISQRPTLLYPTAQRLATGVGFELGKYTYKLEIPANSYIVDVIPKYSNTIHGGKVKNPLNIVVFEHAETQTIDILELPTYHTKHQYFGFDYKYNDRALAEIRPDNRILHDLIIADSPAKTASGEYNFGVHANITLTSDPVAIEDGIKISESFCKKLSFNCFESRTINFTSNAIGLNLYGDENSYKLFPEIGDRVRPDGAVFAIREMDDMLYPSLISKNSLRRPTPYDTVIYGKPNAEVIDIEIIKGAMQQPVFFTGMDEQLEQHYFTQIKFYERVYNAYTKVKKLYGDALRISPAFSRLVREAIAVKKVNQTPLSYRGRTRMQGWMVKVTYKYTLTPLEGFKITDTGGGKGVICAVVPDEQMPVNEIGVRADIIMDDKSPYKRTIMGKHQEIYINAALDKLVYDVKHMVADGKPESYEKAYDHVLGFYKIVSPPYYQLFLENKIDKVRHINELINGNDTIWLPADNPVDYMEVVGLLKQYYPAVYGKVKFKSRYSDEEITSKSDILIGGSYVILLDKIATENAAVSSARTQHFGVPSKLNKNNKHHTPAREQPTKTIAEDESRLLGAVVGGEVTADLLDQTNNPLVHKTVLQSIYSTDKPSALESLVDRVLQPTGHGNIQNMVNNVLQCAGIQFSKTHDVD